MEFNEWNKSVIAEFRANGGNVGGQFAGAPMVIITTTGARSGLKRENPLMYLPQGDDVVIFASKAGMPDNPDWYYNLRANPDVEVERGTERYTATAVITEGAERDRLYNDQATRYPQFADYAAQTTRTIPVIRLVRKA
ncbi:MAG: nitroreductase family deazaflavin-dependent oxidoreductase [Thermoleophilia bacterium]